MTPAAPVGYLASGLVFATFCTKRMVQLRALAIASNIAFIGYGYLGKLWPIVILHAAMLPLNIHRLRQETGGRRLSITNSFALDVNPSWSKNNFRKPTDISNARPKISVKIYGGLRQPLVTTQLGDEE